MRLLTRLQRVKPPPCEGGASQRRTFQLCCALLATLVATAHAGDPAPTSWPQFRQNDKLQGIAGTELPEKLEVLWKYEAGDMISSTAAIVGDDVFVGCLSGELLCLERATGKPRWKYLSAEKTKPNTFLPGFKSSPTVTADLVYLGDEDGVFHAVDRASGTRKWIFKTDGEIISSATVFGDKLLFGSYDNRLYCLDKNEGTLVWQFATDGYVNCTPAIADGHTFITGCDEHLRVIDIETGEQKINMPLNTYLIASPAVRDGLLYVGTYASEVLAIDWNAQSIAWRYKHPEREFPYHSSAAVTEQYVVVGGRDKLVHCIDRKTGAAVWEFPTRGRVDSSPAIVGDRVFIGSSDGNLYELGLRDGKLRDKFVIGKAVTASPAIGEGCLVIGAESSEGTIYCFGKKTP